MFEQDNFDFSADSFKSAWSEGNTYAFRITDIEQHRAQGTIRFTVDASSRPYDTTSPTFGGGNSETLTFIVFTNNPRGREQMAAMAADLRTLTGKPSPSGDDFIGTVWLGEYQEHQSQKTGDTYPSFSNMRRVVAASPVPNPAPWGAANTNSTATPISDGSSPFDGLEDL